MMCVMHNKIAAISIGVHIFMLTVHYKRNFIEGKRENYALDLTPWLNGKPLLERTVWQR